MGTVRTFNSEDAVKIHSRVHPIRFNCAHCYKSFNSDHARRNHTKAVHEWWCDFCDKYFNTEKARDQHEYDVHGSDDEGDEYSDDYGEYSDEDEEDEYGDDELDQVDPEREAKLERDRKWASLSSLAPCIPLF